MAEPKKLNTFALAFKAHRPASNDESIGEMVEWSITTVLKTAVPRGTGGSNPSLSAKSSMSNIVELFFYALSGQASFMVLIVNRIPPYVVGHSFMSFYTLTSPFHTSIPSCSLPLQNKRLSLQPDNNYNKSNEQYAENY